MAQTESERKRKLFERLLARDDFTCKLCGLAVDNTLPRHHPMAPTIDHILPKSKGGTDAQYNLQIAHQKCNNDRGNTPIQEDSNVTRQLIAELSSLRRDFERLDRELRNLRKDKELTKTEGVPARLLLSPTETSIDTRDTEPEFGGRFGLTFVDYSIATDHTLATMCSGRTSEYDSPPL